MTTAAPHRDDPRTPGTGLTTAEVEQRRAAGQTNDVPDPTSRTYGQIIRANVFTRFNALLGALFIAIVAVREYKDGLFGIIVVLNTLIGIIQESRAKQTLDRLSVLSSPKATVRRDGQTVDVAIGELVLGDVVELAPGDQVSVDGEVVEALGLEIDESMLTGEADAIAKDPGDEVMSGSFVSAGSGTIVATKVGVDSYAYKLRADASRFTLVKSELRGGVDTILRFVTWLMVPTALLLITAQFRYEHTEQASMSTSERITEAVQGSVAGLVAMVPEGLVLLTSLAFALGVIRLGRKDVLTQELAAIEGLARVDVICLDKTGTLTEGDLQLDDVDHLGDTSGDTADALAALAHADPNPNASLQAVGTRFPRPPDWVRNELVPFSSARKWAAAAFAGHGSFVLGAPDIVLAAMPDGDEKAHAATRVRGYAENGRRVILLARTDHALTGEHLPPGLRPEALVVLEEKVRADAPDTIRYFLEQGVQVRVISGDSPVTVGAVAQRVGVPGADRPYDARELPALDDVDAIERIADILEDRTVFGRVTPQQKRAMVHALQSKGHEVAMTGDGVNDTLALKDAEIGVAMGSGSPAARSVARFVLLDNSFAVFPSVVAEGRRVIANVERVANLFLTKTFYALAMAIVVGVFGLAFPFVPRHLTLVSALTIGIPGFFLALAPNARRAHPGFLRRVLRFAVPAGLVAATATLAGYLVAHGADGNLEEARTVATIVLYMVATWVLTILARPFNWWRLLMVGTLIALFVGALTVPFAADYFALELPDTETLLAGVGVASIACMTLELGWRIFGWVQPEAEDV